MEASSPARHNAALIPLLLIWTSLGCGGPEAARRPVDATRSEGTSASQPAHDESPSRSDKPESTVQESPRGDASTAGDETILSRWSAASEEFARRLDGCAVHITSPDLPQPAATSTPSRAAWGLSEENVIQGGLGSGTVISADGLILTNEHVVRGMSRLEVVLSDGQVCAAQRLASDAGADVALLRINLPSGRHLANLPWGDSQLLRPGSWVAAVGCPFRDLRQSFSWGMVSSVQCDLGSGPYRDLLQTNTVIHPGFSGGPLVNDRGELVGIHVAIVGSSGHGLSFALPAHRIRPLVERLLNPPANGTRD